MDRRTAALLLVAVVALASVVNATVFAYRWLSGTINIAGPEEASGAACTGFYSAADQQGINLPILGTNYDAPTYGLNTITVETGDVVCQWTYGGKTYYLYESIAITIPVTVGSWYIQDFYAFGYYGTETDPTVYVYFRVEDDATDGGYLNTTYLIIRDSGGTEITRLNLLTLGSQTTAIRLSPGSGLRLDLYLDAATSGTVSFKVGVYVTQESGEAPRP